MEILKKRCELLGSSIVNVVKEKDTKLLSKDLRDSIGRLVAYVSFSEYPVQHSTNWGPGLQGDVDHFGGRK